MIVDYHCDSCGLVFTVGGYSWMRGFVHIVTFMVCEACGSCHRLEYVPERGLYSFFVQPGARVFDDGVKRPVFWHDWLPAPTPSQLQPGFEQFVKQILQSQAALQCLNCESIGTVSHVYSHQSCPHCHEATLNLERSTRM